MLTDDYSPAVHARWCYKRGHDWGELHNVGGARFGRRNPITLERACQRCGFTERHTAEESVAGTNRKPSGW